MNDIRKDFLLERYSLISSVRGKRPHHFAQTEEKKGAICFFCPGNEAMTPPTIDRYPAKKARPWKLRVFRNKFPALKPPMGEHEIIVDTGGHNLAFEDLSAGDILEAMRMYEKRRKALESKYPYVSIFKNHGREAGASIPHAHAQLIAGQLVPSVVAAEAEAAKAYYAKKHRCAWCDYIASASGPAKARVAAKTASTVAITANAPRFPYEAWVLPKSHAPAFSSLGDDEAVDFCSVLKNLLLKLHALGTPSYNIAFHHAPPGASKQFHFHAEILPRLSTHAGYELCEGAYIIDTPPEDAARFYSSPAAPAPV